MKCKKPIDFTLVRRPISGSLTFSRDTLLGLHVEGGIAGFARRVRAACVTRLDPGPDGLSVVRMDALNFDKTSIVILGGPVVTTGSISITKLEDGKVGFRGHTPTGFEATIRKALATEIRWRL